MSYFAANLQIGQGVRPHELNIEKGITSSQGKRFRDRDEYVKSVLTGGASAPEGINVKGVASGGFSKTPQAYFLSGLSIANQTWMVSPDLRWWVPYQTWLWVINKPFTLTKTSYVHAQAQFAASCASSRSGLLYLGLFLEGALVAPVGMNFIQWPLVDQPYPPAYNSECSNLSWDGVMTAGAHQIGLALYVQFPPTGFGQIGIQSIYAPTLSILIL